jgi:hypothetical protein
LNFSLSCNNINLSAGGSGNVEYFAQYVESLGSGAFFEYGKLCFLQGVAAGFDLYYPTAAAAVLHDCLKKYILYCAMHYPVSLASLLSDWGMGKAVSSNCFWARWFRVILLFMEVADMQLADRCKRLHPILQPLVASPL